MAEGNYPAKKVSIKDTPKFFGSGSSAKQGDKRTGGTEKAWIGQGSSDIEIKIDSLTFEEDNLWSTEKPLDHTTRKQSKTLLTVPKPSYKCTPKSASCSDEETLTLSKWNSALSVPKFTHREFRAKRQSKALLTVPKPSYKYVSTSAPCSDEETQLIDIAALKKKDNTIPIPVEIDIRCKQECVPIVYDARYNIETRKAQLELPPQSIQLNKPAQVFSKIKGERYNTVKSADIATIYEISCYVSAPLRQLDVKKLIELMKLDIPETTTWKSFSSVVLRPLRYQMMGSVLACNLAIEKGWAINIGGGFSHYTTNIGGGLAVYDDVLVCLAIISNLPGVSHIMVINVDAYQSPCYKYEKNINCPVTIIDFYSEPIIEMDDSCLTSKRNEHVKYHEHMISDATYMYSTGREISKYFYDAEFIRPSLCIYVAGTTVLAENPFSTMHFNTEHLVRRDLHIFKLLREHKVPVAYLMGGGYQAYDVEASSAAISKILTEHCKPLARKSSSKKMSPPPNSSSPSYTINSHTSAV